MNLSSSKRCQNREHLICKVRLITTKKMRKEKNFYLSAQFQKAFSFHLRKEVDNTTLFIEMLSHFNHSKEFFDSDEKSAKYVGSRTSYHCTMSNLALPSVSNFPGDNSDLVFSKRVCFFQYCDQLFAGGQIRNAKNRSKSRKHFHFF